MEAALPVGGDSFCPLRVPADSRPGAGFPCTSACARRGGKPRIHRRQQGANYVAEQILWILPNILPVLAFTALFVALAPAQRSLALIALIFGALPWALILAVPVSSRGSLNLIYLSDRYLEAGTEEERRVFATAAEAILAENNTPAIVGTLSAFGILLMAVAMATGPRALFPQWIAWLGVATGALGVVSEILRHAVPEFYWGYGILLWVWFVATGFALIRLSGHRTDGKS
ncbi:DUF4386 family protein [Arthrobacter sp. BB-1]|uniref:DUF4386 family protein n=1 Tax=unclassified Arthrobacter TaxID=235627 RepID=UPI001111FD70|nr:MULTISPECIES: DUF4386 family protein [unclassified Arthrobacter]TNB72131.1 DUF4386 family protein [Arthrobacter sp. BB-1]